MSGIFKKLRDRKDSKDKDKGAHLNESPATESAPRASLVSVKSTETKKGKSKEPQASVAPLQREEHLIHLEDVYQL